MEVLFFEWKPMKVDSRIISRHQRKEIITKKIIIIKIIFFFIEISKMNINIKVKELIEIIRGHGLKLIKGYEQITIII